MKNSTKKKRVIYYFIFLVLPSVTVIMMQAFFIVDPQFYSVLEIYTMEKSSEALNILLGSAYLNILWAFATGFLVASWLHAIINITMVALKQKKSDGNPG